MFGPDDPMKKLAIESWARRNAFVRLVVVASIALLGCAGTQSVRDTSYVEVLRIDITKVRGAIDETRSTIAASQGATYLPELYLRLAELLSEEAMYHYRLARERQQGDDQVLQVPQVRLLKEQSIAVYELLLRRFPDSSLTDRALFNIGHEQRELGNHEEMRQALVRLVNDHPRSPLRDEALIILGDSHFDRDETGPARRYYQLLLQGTSGRFTELAHYKLGLIAVSEENCPLAMRSFEAALRSNRERIERRRAAEAAAESDDAGRDGQGDAPALETSNIDVGEAALSETAYCYTQERPSASVLSYLREHSRDRAVYVLALRRYAQRYRIVDEVQGNLLITRELLRLGSGSADRLDDIRSLHTALRAEGRYDRIGEDIELAHGALLRHLGRAEVDSATRARLLEEFEVYSRDLLTRAHDAIESAPQSARNARARSVAAGYESYLAVFEGSPEAIAMLQNCADVLVIAERPFEAGERSLEVAQLLPSETEEHRDALYDAVTSFEAALGPEATTSRPARSIARAGLRRAGGELLRYPLDPERDRRLKFALALTYYDEGRYAEAIDHFMAVAYQYPGSTESAAATRLVLDSYNTLNDTEGLLAAAERFLAEGSPAAGLRGEIEPIASAAEQRLIDELSLEAAGDEGVDIGVLAAFAEEHRGSGLGERALLNAFLAARAAGDSEALYRMGDQLASSYPSSEQLPGTLSTLGQTAVSRFEIDRALGFLDQASRIAGPEQARILLVAGTLIEARGDLEAAAERYREVLRLDAGAGHADALERYASVVERQGDARRTFELLAPHAGTRNPAVLARLGVAQLASGQLEQAEASLQGALAGGGDSAASARAQYGMAEILAATLTRYPEIQDAMALEEFVTLIDVAQDGFLTAARIGDREVSVVALSRLAHVLGQAEERLGRLGFLSSLAREEAEVVREALLARVDALRALRAQLLDACVQAAFTRPSMGPTARGCLRGETQPEPGLRFDPVRAATASPGEGDASELRASIARNPEQVDQLIELAEHLLDVRAPSDARVVAAAAVERSSDATALNVLGLACAAVEDVTCALESFARAAAGGSEAGRQNLRTMLRRQGLEQAADGVLERFAPAQPGGRLLGASR